MEPVNIGTGEDISMADFAEEINGDEITLRKAYLEKIPSISVDYAILEKRNQYRNGAV